MADQPTDPNPPPESPGVGTLVQGPTAPMVSGLTYAQPTPSPLSSVQVTPGMRVPIRFGSQIGTVDAGEYQTAVAQGGVPLSDEEYAQHLAEVAEAKRLKERRDQYGGIGAQLETGAVGAASGLTLGLSDAAIGGAASKATKERLRQEAAENPIAHGAGKLAGMAAPILLSGGSAAPLEGAAEGVNAARLAAEGIEAAEASGAVKAAQQAATATQGAQATAQVAPGVLANAGRVLAAPQNLVAQVGTRVEHGIASLLSRDAQGLAGKLAADAVSTGVGQGVVGGIQGGADYLSEQALSKDPELDGQKLAAAIGMGALWGGATGGLLGAGGGLLHDALKGVDGGPILARVKREANEQLAWAGTEGRQTGAAKKLYELPHEGYANGADAFGGFLHANIPAAQLVGKTVTDIAPVTDELASKMGQRVGALRTTLDNLGVKGVTQGRLHEVLDGVVSSLPPSVRDSARAVIDGVKADIAEMAEAGTKEQAAAREAKAVEASGAVKSARAAENTSINNVENAKRAQVAAEAQETATAARASTMSERLEAARAARAQAASEAERLSSMRTPSPKEYRAFIKTPEGQARVETFIREESRAPTVADLFPKADAKAAKLAERTLKVADGELARAEAQTAKAKALADAAKAEHGTRMAQTDTAAAAADAARMARHAAEETAAKASNAVETAARETPLTFEQLGKIRGTLDDKIKGWNRSPFGDADLKGAALKKVRGALEDELTRAGDEGTKALGPGHEGWLEKYKDAKLDYRKALLANEMFTKAAISRGKNAGASLTDQLVGGFASHLAAGPVGIVTGLAGAAVHKAIRERGRATAAVVLDKIAAMGAIKKATERVDNQIDAGVAAILGHGSPKKVGGPPSHGLGSFEERRDAVLDAAKELRSSGDGTFASAVGAVAGLAPHAPNIAASFRASASRAVAFLMSTMPQDRPVNPMQPLGPQIEPSDLMKRGWSRQVDALHNPMSIMAKAADGTLTPEENHAVATVLPSIHAAMANKTKGAIQMSPKPLTYKAITGASTLIGMPMDPTLAAVPFYQAMLAPPPPQPNIGTPPKHERSNAKAGKMHFADDSRLKGQGTGI